MKGKYAVAGLAVVVIGVGGYYAYKYFSARAKVADQNATNSSNVGLIGGLLGDLQKSGGVTGVLGSVF